MTNGVFRRMIMFDSALSIWPELYVGTQTGVLQCVHRKFVLEFAFE